MHRIWVDSTEFRFGGKNVSRSKVCGQRASFPVAALSPVALVAYFSLGLLPQKVIARWPHDGLGINLGFLANPIN